jgi:hypothetical protein
VDRADTAGRGFAMGCGRTDHGDDTHDDDKDRDHDFDDDDYEHEQNRRENW